jgi:hypothetical protein
MFCKLRGVSASCLELLEAVASCAELLGVANAGSPVVSPLFHRRPPFFIRGPRRVTRARSGAPSRSSSLHVLPLCVPCDHLVALHDAERRGGGVSALLGSQPRPLFRNGRPLPRLQAGGYSLPCSCSRARSGFFATFLPIIRTQLLDVAAQFCQARCRCFRCSFSAGVRRTSARATNASSPWTSNGINLTSVSFVAVREANSTEHRRGSKGPPLAG